MYSLSIKFSIRFLMIAGLGWNLFGTVDYALDFASLLAGHKDGDRVLAALGGKLPGARLTGSLDAPKLRLPDLGELATGLLEQNGWYRATEMLRRCVRSTGIASGQEETPL